MLSEEDREDIEDMMSDIRSVGIVDMDFLTVLLNEYGYEIVKRSDDNAKD